MKKISLFLATIMFFLAVAVMPGNLQEVQAFPFSQYPKDEPFITYASANEGSKIFIGFSFPYSSYDVKKEDLIGSQLALCPPEKSNSIEDAVALWNVDEEDIIEEANYIAVRKSVVLEKSIPEGHYSQVLFDKSGKRLDGYLMEQVFVNQSLMNFSYSIMNNDGYIYAYVYERDLANGIDPNENTYPTLYDSNRSTVLTSYDAFTTHINSEENLWAGEKVYVYRLKMLDASKFEFNENEPEMAYYKVNGGYTPATVFTGGFGLSGIINADRYAEEGIEVVSPFDKKNDSSNNEKTDVPEDNNKKDDSQPDSVDTTPNITVPASASSNSTTTSSVPVTPEIVVAPLTDSAIPEIQSSIVKVNKLVEEISSNQSDVVSTLKAYAPDVDFSSVTNGGTLDISEKNGVDISAGTQVTFTDERIAANVTSADTVIVLHVKHDGTIERVPAVAGDGKITATFTSLSPVAWFKVSSAEKTTVVSPKTGENFWSFLFH